MAMDQLVLRMLCADARVDAHRLRTGNLQEKDWARLAKAYADLSASKIFIDDSAMLTPLEIRAKCRRLKAEHGLGMVIVDYLQLVTGSGRIENRQQEISSISRSMKGLAKELGVPVIALSQLSRAVEQRGGEGEPKLSDLRESGAIEQDADIVMFIFREEEYKATDENRGLAEIIIGKQRNGPTGTVKLAFLKEFTRFENFDWRGGS
jgi:replicative DNA helicase